MLIGVYRDNEVYATHPLMRKLEAVKAAGGKLAEITLASLAREHLEQLIAGAIRCEPAGAVALAQLVHEKTGSAGPPAGRNGRDCARSARPRSGVRVNRALRTYGRSGVATCPVRVGKHRRQPWTVTRRKRPRRNLLTAPVAKP
jgi:hypothetical protein